MKIPCHISRGFTFSPLQLIQKKIRVKNFSCHEGKFFSMKIPFAWVVCLRTLFIAYYERIKESSEDESGKHKQIAVQEHATTGKSIEKHGRTSRKEEKNFRTLFCFAFCPAVLSRSQFMINYYNFWLLVRVSIFLLSLTFSDFSSSETQKPSHLISPCVHDKKDDVLDLRLLQFCFGSEADFYDPMKKNLSLVTIVFVSLSLSFLNGEILGMASLSHHS